MARTTTTPSLGEPLLSDADAAKILRVSRTTVRRLRYDGFLPYLRVGGAARIRPEDLAAYIARWLVNVTE